MPTAATGPLSLAREALRNTIAASATFRTWIGATGSSANQNVQALARIFTDEIPLPDSGESYAIEEIQAMRPYAIISTLSYTSEFESMSDAHKFDEGGVLELQLEDSVPFAIALDQSEVGQRFENNVGGVIADLKTLAGGVAGSTAYLRIVSINMDEPWVRTSAADRPKFGDATLAIMTIGWGQE